MLSDIKFLVEPVKLCATKLVIIIHDYHLGKTISMDDRFPHKVFHPYLCNTGQRFSFDPFSDVINSHQQEFALSSSSRKWAKNIYPPLSERSLYGDWS